jgi:hypothetical protein
MEAPGAYGNHLAMPSYAMWNMFSGSVDDEMQYADFEEAQEEAIQCHSCRGIKRESIMTHS